MGCAVDLGAVVCLSGMFSFPVAGALIRHVGTYEGPGIGLEAEGCGTNLLGFALSATPLHSAGDVDYVIINMAQKVNPP
ncbi:hypothetical protein D9619_012909 [Psilocybe cf. subviscida]|uniref:Uncharacterized protein n=1 Tax=Psilocybe cf. subviscida TaxID=2480587 RepID=A0A8H5F4Z4_9AGAR|nr:hypothetical protein D9619_012909 [Psilocybe cf. subviscida]